MGRQVVRWIVFVVVFGLVSCDRTSMEPTLVVTFVVSGLSADQLSRHRDCLGEGGFDRLLDEGHWFRQAFHAHAVTQTGPGHATIATGTSPRTHGIVADAWFDRELRRPMDCVEDSRHEVVGDDSRGPGASPAHLLVPTFGDHLDEATAGQSRTIAVAGDRHAAVLAAGRTGVGYWFSQDSGRFVSSTFHLREMSAWWETYHAKSPHDRWFGDDLDEMPCPDLPWFSSHEASLEYVGESDARLDPAPTLVSPSGRPDRAYYAALCTTSRGDRMTLEFARAALEGEELGRRGVVDHLFVGLSSLDRAQHLYGPDSPRVSALLDGLDDALGEFLEALDDAVGEKGWVAVLTSDHGCASSPEVARAQGRAGGRLDPELLRQVVVDAVAHRFGGRDWVQGWVAPGIALDRERIERRGLDLAYVQRIAAEALSIQPGIERVVSSSVLGSALPTGAGMEEVAAGFHAARSGDLLLVPKEDWALGSESHDGAATHGSGHFYDRQVPLLLRGAGFTKGLSDLPAATADIVPTMLRRFAIPLPAGLDGTVLQQALAP